MLQPGRFGDGLAPAEPFPLPIHTGDVRVDVQAGLAMLAPIWGYPPLLDIDDQREVDLRQIETIAIVPIFEERQEPGVTGQARDVVDQGRIGPDIPKEGGHERIGNAA